MFARGYACITGFNTTFVLFMCHNVSFLLWFGLFLFQRTPVRKFIIVPPTWRAGSQSQSRARRIAPEKLWPIY